MDRAQVYSWPSHGLHFKKKKIEFGGEMVIDRALTIIQTEDWKMIIYNGHKMMLSYLRCMIFVHSCIV